jgi:hypothetical protein
VGKESMLACFISDAVFLDQDLKIQVFAKVKASEVLGLLQTVPWSFLATG